MPSRFASLLILPRSEGRSNAAAHVPIRVALATAILVGTLGTVLLAAPASAGAMPVNLRTAADSVIAAGPNGLPTIAVQGPRNSLWVYWEAPGGVWDGPLGVGVPGSTHGVPAVSIGPNGLPTIAVQGPSNSLWVYWEAPGGVWDGPLGVGAPGSTLSAPAIALGSSGLPVIAAEGPTDTLWVYWETPGGQWVGPLGVGQPGTTYSAPAMASGADGLPTIAVQGPANSLWTYAQSSGGKWQVTMGAGDIGSTFSTPSVTIGATGLPMVAVQGPANSLWLFWQTGSGQWAGPLGPGAAGSTYSAPSIGSGPTGLPVVTVQGPSNTLWLYWQASGGTWYGPLGPGAPGSTNAAPAVAFAPSGLPTVAVQGPSNTLWLYWETPGAQWLGPLGPGAPGSTYLSTGPGDPPPPESTVGNGASTIAVGQDGVGDNPASMAFSFDCNPYTAILYPGLRSSACGVDARFGVQDASEEWCADFAKFIWISAGLTSGLATLNPEASSFYTWGVQHGESLTADGGSPQVGDAIVFYPPGDVGGGYADHVGIVSAVNPNGTVNIVNGDFQNGSNIMVEEDDNVLPGPYASQIWSPGEEWVYVAP